MAKDFSRIDRIAEQIQRELAELIRLEVKDPRVKKVTLTGVEVTNDHAHAKVFYTSLDGDSPTLLQGLERSVRIPAQPVGTCHEAAYHAPVALRLRCVRRARRSSFPVDRSSGCE